MKFWVVFIVLKILEVSGIVFVPHFLGKAICKKFPHLRYDNMPPYWVVGFMGCLVIVLTLMIGFGIVALNIEWTRGIIKP